MPSAGSLAKGFAQRSSAAHSDAKDVPLQWTGSKDEEKEGLLRGAMAKEGWAAHLCAAVRPSGHPSSRSHWALSWASSCRSVTVLYKTLFIMQVREMIVILGSLCL